MTVITKKIVLALYVLSFLSLLLLSFYLYRNQDTLFPNTMNYSTTGNDAISNPAQFHKYYKNRSIVNIDLTLRGIFINHIETRLIKREKNVRFGLSQIYGDVKIAPLFGNRIDYDGFRNGFFEYDYGGKNWLVGKFNNIFMFPFEKVKATIVGDTMYCVYQGNACNIKTLKPKITYALSTDKRYTINSLSANRFDGQRPLSFFLRADNWYICIIALLLTLLLWPSVYTFYTGEINSVEFLTLIGGALLVHKIVFGDSYTLYLLDFIMIGEIFLPIIVFSVNELIWQNNPK
ncbi:MAG: hypothetical protein ACYCYL_06365 [Acidithiobacillus sp.]